MADQEKDVIRVRSTEALIDDGASSIIRHKQIGFSSDTHSLWFRDIDDTIYEYPNVGNLLDGSGSADFVLKWVDSNTVTDSVMRESLSNIGIGTVPAGAKLHISGNVKYGNEIGVSTIIDELVETGGGGELNTWTQLYAVGAFESGLIEVGAKSFIDGNTPDITSNYTRIRYHYGNALDIDTLTSGDAGVEVQFQVSGGNIQYRMDNVSAPYTASDYLRIWARVHKYDDDWS